MHRMRWPALAAAAVCMGVGLGVAAVATADDTSNYDGKQCGADQFFDATDQSCADSVISNDPNGVPQPQDVGANYDGTRCEPGQIYDASQASCTLAAVTNDPQTQQRIEVGAPLDSDLPPPPVAPPLESAGAPSGAR